MARRIDTALEGYLKASVYMEGPPKDRIGKAIRRGKPDPEQIIDASPQVRADRECIGIIARSGSAREIADMLLRGYFVPSGRYDYRTLAENSEIPHDLQNSLVRRFVQLASDEERHRDRAPNRAGLAFIALTIAGTVGGALGETGFAAGLGSALIAACIAWKKKAGMLDANLALGMEMLGSGRLTSREARETLSDFCQRPKDA